MLRRGPVNGMGEQRKEQRPAFRLIQGEGRSQDRAMRRVMGRRNTWLLSVSVACGLLAAVAFLVAPAFSRQAPHLTPEEVAAAVAASEGHGPFLGSLAEVLELDAGQTAALGRTLDRFDRTALAPRQARDAALEVLRSVPRGPEVEAEASAAAAVDEALASLRAAQARLQALDAELVEAAAEGLAPWQRAQVALLLGHYHERGGPEGRAEERAAARGQAPHEVRPARRAPAARP